MNVRFDRKALKFVWDFGNISKIESKHRVSTIEVEEVLHNLPLLLKFDSLHSEDEARYHLLGMTSQGKRLFIVMTYRDSCVRVISARMMSRKERLIFNSVINEFSTT